MVNLASAAADDAPKLTAGAAPYHDAIAGLGGGLAKLAKQLVGDWQGKKLHERLRQTDSSYRIVSDIDKAIDCAKDAVDAATSVIRAIP